MSRKSRRKRLAQNDVAASPQSVEPRHRRTVSMICGGLIVAVLVVFGQTIRHDFVNYDDDLYVYHNDHVTRGLAISEMQWAMTTGHAANWHPVTWLSHMLDCQFYDLAPRGHHLSNIVLHAANAVLLLLLVWRMTGELWPSALVAALFAVHPLRVESVAWVAERKDLLSGLFFLLTLMAYVGYARHAFSLVRYLTVVALFALGLMCKPMLVTLPLVLLLLDYWPLGRLREGWRILAEKIPLFMLSAGSCVATIVAQQETVAPIAGLSMEWRIANAVVAAASYLGQYFYPAGLAVFYPHPAQSLSAWKIVGACVVLIAITTAAVTWLRRRPYLAVGWFWHLGMLVPVIGLVQVGVQAQADRYTYLPQIGLSLALVWLVADFVQHMHSRFWIWSTIASLALASLTVCAWRQTTFWRNSETLWARALACTVRNDTAHNNLATALVSRGEHDAAIAHYKEALKITPDYAEANFNLANELRERGQLEPAIEHYQRALGTNPNFADAYSNLGLALALRGRTSEAIAQYRNSLNIAPDNAAVHNNLGNALLSNGEYGAAVQEYQHAIDLQPDYPEAQCNWGTAMLKHGQFNAAVDHYERALRLKPGLLEARFGLGNALQQQGEGPAALAQWRTALKLAEQQNQFSAAEFIKAKIVQAESGGLILPPLPLPAATSGKQ